MAHSIKKLAVVVLLGVFLVPVVTGAVVQINPEEPVPVPFETQFSQFCIFGLFCAAGPAGQVTAGGLIVSFINIGLAIAGLVAVLFLIIGGFRYITASGNEEQAEMAKKTLQHSVLGIVIIILSFVIVRVITNALIFGPIGV